MRGKLLEYLNTTLKRQIIKEKKEKEPDEKVTLELGVGIELLNRMITNAQTFCMNLKLCQYTSQGNIEHGNVNFHDEWNGIIKGSRCIRMGSTIFIGTGLHYLRALYRENIPNVDVKRLDRIY